MADETSTPAAALTGQTALNVARYEDVFRHCLASARRIMGDENGEPRPSTLKVAEAIFGRFAEDQVTLSKQDALVKAAKPLLEAVQRNMDRRGNLF